MPTATDCPCGSGRALADCCGPIIDGSRPAPTAEALMRSRYSAYVTGDIKFIENSLAQKKRHKFDHDSALNWSESSQWKGLTIHEVEAGGEEDEQGIVEFTAAFELSGEAQEHRERAQFHREDGAWMYVDGDVMGSTYRREAPKVGRNEPCPCGSGKKFKKCCGR